MLEISCGWTFPREKWKSKNWTWLLRTIILVDGGLGLDFCTMK